MSLRFLLRNETGEAHAALHHLPCFAGLARSSIAPADYGRLLQRLESFYAALDPVLAAAGSCFARATGAASHVARAPILLTDLAAAGLPPERPLRGAPEPPRCPAAFAGMLYVVDGAVLGGAVLRRAAARLDWPAPAAFWRWAEVEGPALWRRTQALLDRVDDGGPGRRAAIAAADATFAAFGAWMVRPGEASP